MASNHIPIASPLKMRLKKSEISFLNTLIKIIIIINIITGHFKNTSK